MLEGVVLFEFFVSLSILCVGRPHGEIHVDVALRQSGFCFKCSEKRDA